MNQLRRDLIFSLSLANLCFLRVWIPYSTRDRWALDGSGDYLGNLLLADRTLGELRKAMERAGVWDSTTLLLFSDHGLRATADNVFPLWGNEPQTVVRATTDRHVPFLVKLAGYKMPVTFNSPLSTVLSCDLVIAVLRGNVATPENLTRWVDRNRRYEPGMPASAQTQGRIGRHP
jgi:arylsulfatase A-like enzyme